MQAASQKIPQQGISERIAIGGKIYDITLFDWNASKRPSFKISEVITNTKYTNTKEFHYGYDVKKYLAEAWKQNNISQINSKYNNITAKLDLAIKGLTSSGTKDVMVGLDNYTIKRTEAG